MKRIFYILISVAALGWGLVSCKTSEANYRAAYEKAIAGRENDAALDSTIYGDIRRQMTARTVEASDGRKVEVRSQHVRVTADAGGIPENLKRFNVAVGQFKQLFNAKSLRNRLVDMGYPGIFVVETAEPYYYVILSSFQDAGAAADALEAFADAKPIVMKEPLPFILDAAGRRR